MQAAKLTAKVFDIQRASMVDGPGVRTTVFFNGCNLKCEWCHNPEGLVLSKNDLDGEYSTKEYTVEELADIVSEDIPFYKKQGGVTCSGGECMLQSDFLLEFLKECKKRGINTAVDTAGNIPFEKFSVLLPFVDCFLYDIKCITPELHKKFTGVDNSLILSNLSRLFNSDANIIIRVPLIPEFNGNDSEMLKIKDFLENYNPLKVELLPYHTLGIGKYKKLGIAYKNFSVPNESTTNYYKKMLGAE